MHSLFCIGGNFIASAYQVPPEEGKQIAPFLEGGLRAV
jgi:hypothetical protein